jgi:hypothetical protein
LNYELQAGNEILAFFQKRTRKQGPYMRYSTGSREKYWAQLKNKILSKSKIEFDPFGRKHPISGSDLGPCSEKEGLHYSPRKYVH